MIDSFAKHVSLITAVVAVVLLTACAEEVISEPVSDAVADNIIVADFRISRDDVSIASPEVAQRVIESVFGTPVPDDVWLAGHSRGAFTSADEVQSLYLLARGAQIHNQQSQSKLSLLAVFVDEQVTAQFVPPDHAYNTIQATVDVNDDGIDDVLLTSSAYQMGQSVIMAELLSLAGGQRQQLHSLGKVYQDSCDAPFSKEGVVAAVIEKSPDGQLIRSDFVADCPEGDREPVIDDFVPVT